MQLTPTPFHLGAVKKSREIPNEIQAASPGRSCERASANISQECMEFAVSTGMSLRNLVRIRQMLLALKFLENHNE